MKTINHMKLGGTILIIAVALKLFMGVYLFAVSTQTPLVIRTIGILFGRVFVDIYLQLMTTDHSHVIHWKGLIFLPWTGLYLAFLGWLAVMAINGKFNRSFIPLVIASAVWFLAGMFYSKLRMLLITGGFFHIFQEMPAFYKVNLVLSEISVMMLIIGLALIAYAATRRSAAEMEQNVIPGMGFWGIVLSLNGRIPRSVFWIYFVFMSVLVSLIVFAAIVTLSPGIVIAGIYLLNIFLFWPSLAISFKRCHDRNRSGWFILVGLIPVVGLWYAIEMLFLRGSAGENSYGPEYQAQPGQTA